MRIAPKEVWRKADAARMRPAITKPGNQNRVMQNNTVETLIGAVVVIVAAAFLYFTYTATSQGSVSGYEIKARFAAVDGVSVGTDVRLDRKSTRLNSSH